MTVWRRQPDDTVPVHSGQDWSFTGHDWQGFLQDHKLVSPRCVK